MADTSERARGLAGSSSACSDMESKYTRSDMEMAAQGQVMGCERNGVDHVGKSKGSALHCIAVIHMGCLLGADSCLTPDHEGVAREVGRVSWLNNAWNRVDVCMN